MYACTVCNCHKTGNISTRHNNYMYDKDKLIQKYIVSGPLEENKMLQKGVKRPF